MKEACSFLTAFFGAVVLALAFAFLAGDLEVDFYSSAGVLLRPPLLRLVFVLAFALDLLLGLALLLAAALFSFPLGVALVSDLEARDELTLASFYSSLAICFLERPLVALARDLLASGDLLVVYFVAFLTVTFFPAFVFAYDLDLVAALRLGFATRPVLVCFGSGS